MTYPPSQKPPIWSIDPGVIAYNCQRAGMPHPVLAMPMWGGGGNLVRDYSGHGNHGNIISGTGTVDWVSQGIYVDPPGTAGTYKYISVPHSESLNLTSAITIFSFVKLPAVQTDTAWTKIATKGYDNCWTLQAQWSNSKQAAMRRWSGSAHVYSQGTTDIFIDKDVAVCGTYGDGYTKIYIDGKLEDLDSASGDLDTNSSNIDIFSDSATTITEVPTGYIYEFVIFPNCLSAAQVKFISNNPYFMYQIPEELYGYTAAAPPVGNPFWYYNMLRRRN